MKKILVVLLLLIATQVFALPSWNPWIRTWTFLIGEQELVFRFDSHGNAKDLKTGRVYTYDWDMSNLYIFDYNDNDLIFDGEFDAGQSYFNGVEITSSLEVIATVGM